MFETLRHDKRHINCGLLTRLKESIGKNYLHMKNWKTQLFFIFNFFVYLETIEIKIKKCIVRVDPKKIYFHTSVAVSEEIIVWMLQNFNSIQILLFLVGFRVQKKCNLKFHVFKRFDTDWSLHQWEFISIKNTKEET